MNRQEKIDLLINNGWECPYHSELWCHPKTVENEVLQDYTSYGMSVFQAVCFELFKLPPFALNEGQPALAIRKRFNNEKSYHKYIDNFSISSID